MREGSPTYGQWHGVLLSAENKKQFFIPKNFAHGFVVLSESAEFAYKCTDFYHPNDEGGLAWNDPEIGVDWPMPEGMTEKDLIISEKDQHWGGIREYRKYGLQEEKRVKLYKELCEISAASFGAGCERDIEIKYRRSVLGVLWTLLNPLAA